jgi:MFS family permease
MGQVRRMSDRTGPEYWGGARWPVLRLAVPALLGLLAVGLAVSAVWPQLPVPAGTAGQAGGDAASYLEIVDRMRGGENYYAAAHEVLRNDGFGTRSVFNWRTPIWPTLLAVLPGLWAAQALLAGLAGVALAVQFRVFRAEGGLAVALASVSAVAGSLIGIAAPESVLFTEVAAGLLILLAVSFHAAGWRMAGHVAGLLALFVRELAAPLIVVSLMLAIRQRRWREVVLLSGGLALYVLYFSWHAVNVAAQLGPADQAYAEGWVQFGGLGFLVKTLGFNGIWGLLPSPLAVLMLPLGLHGLWRWPRGGLAGLTVLVFIAAFAMIGKPFNGYWGALYTPVLMLGMGWVAAGPSRSVPSPNGL